MVWHPVCRLPARASDHGSLQLGQSRNRTLALRQWTDNIAKAPPTSFHLDATMLASIVC